MTIWQFCRGLECTPAVHVTHTNSEEVVSKINHLTANIIDLAKSADVLRWTFYINFNSLRDKPNLKKRLGKA